MFSVIEIQTYVEENNTNPKASFSMNFHCGYLAFMFIKEVHNGFPPPGAEYAVLACGLCTRV